jgi:hypothetical protein
VRLIDDFAAALLAPQRPPPAGLRAWNGSDPGPRFDVYRNNVISSLTAALADTFGVVQALVGPDFFRAMAGSYIAGHPPRSPVLAEYGACFADYVAGFAPAASLPFLPDMARLEFARVQTFHAADVPALDAARLAAHLAQPDQLEGARIDMRPDVHVLSSRHAVVSLWAAHQGLHEIGTVDPTAPEAAMVLRVADDSAVIPLPHAAAHFISAWAGGHTLGAAAAAASAEPAIDGQTFDLAATLALLIGHGAIAAWHAPEHMT